MNIISKFSKKYIVYILLLTLSGTCFISLMGYKLGKIGVADEMPVFSPEDVEIIKVTDDNGMIINNVNLNIFNNEKFNNESMIAPRSYGKYHFYVSNVSNKRVKYDVDFTDKMTNKINMKYKLKIDGVYIRGNENEYISINELNIDDINLMKESVNSFVLEWYWEDDDINDAYIGELKEKQYYTLNLKVNGDVLS